MRLGAIDLVEVSRRCIVVSLSGTFWHPLDQVKEKVERVLASKLPEVIVVVDRSKVK